MYFFLRFFFFQILVVIPSLARVSAISLPSIPQCDGTHCILRLSIFFHYSFIFSHNICRCALLDLWLLSFIWSAMNLASVYITPFVSVFSFFHSIIAWRIVYSSATALDFITCLIFMLFFQFSFWQYIPPPASLVSS